MECCERNDLIEPVGCNDGTLPPKLMAEFLHPPGVDQPPRTLAVVHPIPLPQSSTSIFLRAGRAAFYATDLADDVNDRLDPTRTTNHPPLFTSRCAHVPKYDARE